MPSVAEFLIERLGNSGIKHIFGVPGDYLSEFIGNLSQNEKIKFVSNTDENHAGFAADAYARANGIGCVCATYSVGALKLCNSIAGAYAEKSPVVVISGSPGIKERNEDLMLHHVLESFDNQHKIFSHITCCSVVLDNSTTAGWKIDNALEMLRHNKQPIYIELPRDVASQPIKYDVYTQGTPVEQKSDPESLKEAMDETINWIKNSKTPVIIAGVQITRFGLDENLVRFAEKNNIPIVTTLLSKSSINENHELFAGVYCGNQTSQECVRKLVDDSDCLLVLGEMLTEMLSGFQTPKFTKQQTIFCSTEGLKIKNHIYNGVKFTDFCKDLFKIDLGKKEKITLEKKESKVFTPVNGALITVDRFFEKINNILNEKMAVVADIGESLFGATRLNVHHHQFISPAFYCSMGLAIPGALGFQMAKPNIRPIVLVGDGAFQMSVSEISTILQHKLNPIIFVLNNKGYATEKNILNIFIRDWSYHKVSDMMGGGFGYKVETEDQLEESISLSLKNKVLSVINVCLDPVSVSLGLKSVINSTTIR